MRHHAFAALAALAAAACVGSAADALHTDPEVATVADQAPPPAIQLERNDSVIGTIVDADGAPVPGAVYWVFRAEFRPQRRTADERGRFEIQDVPGGGVAVAAGDSPCRREWPAGRFADDPDAVLALATRLPAGTRDARVSLAADRALRVTLVGPHGVAAYAGSTRLLGPAREGRRDGYAHDAIVSDEGRALLFTGLDSGVEYRLFARNEARGLVVWEEGLRPGAQITATWREGTELVGKVVLSDRKDVHRVDVRAEIGDVWFSTTTARDGTFRYACLPPATVCVSVFASEADGDWYDRFEVMPGGDPVELTPKDKTIPATPR